MEIIFSTKTYKKEMKKSPKIQTNEGTPDKRVTIISHVVTRPDSTYPIIIKPYKLDISQFGKKVRDNIKFTIRNVSEEDLAITLIDQPMNMFELDIPDKVKAGKSVEGQVTIVEDILETSFEKSITIELGDEEKTRFTIPVKRTYKAPARAEAGKKGN